MIGVFCAGHLSCPHPAAVRWTGDLPDGRVSWPRISRRWPAPRPPPPCRSAPYDNHVHKKWAVRRGFPRPRGPASGDAFRSERHAHAANANGISHPGFRKSAALDLAPIMSYSQTGMTKSDIIFFGWVCFWPKLNDIRILVPRNPAVAIRGGFSL